jgi:hypothetical protein
MLTQRQEWLKMIDKLYLEKGIEEVIRHALVSTQNKHYCKECFCCACVDWLRMPMRKAALALTKRRN